MRPYTHLPFLSEAERYEYVISQFNTIIGRNLVSDNKRTKLGWKGETRTLDFRFIRTAL